jgi:hypothetical protein
MLAVLIVALLGCQATVANKHLQPIYGYPETVSSSVNFDHKVDFNTYKTFAIIDPDDNRSGNQLAGLSGNSIKFIVSDELERFGYIPVFDEQVPDMLVTISGRVDSSSTRMAGGSGILPVWRPGQTYTYSGTSNSTFNAYSNFENSYYGSLSGTQFGTLKSPGQMGFVPYQRPDYMVEKNHAQLIVVAFDAHSKKELVIGRISGDTVSADPSLATQFLIVRIMEKFPPNKKGQEEFDRKSKWKGSIGFLMFSRSLSGSNMYPHVLYVVPDSPAEQGGLRIEDIIVSINGIETNNVPVTKLLRDIVVHPGDIVRMKVWRGGDKFKELEFKAASRAEVYEAGNR